MTGFPARESRYPAALIEEREKAAAADDFRARVRYDLVPRPHHACGLLAAADMAAFCGVEEITAIEFGVAAGAGLRNLVDVAGAVTAETGVRFRFVGFDTGLGLPPPVDHRDHPEIWTEGDFSMGDPDELRRDLDGSAELVLGDIRDTLDPFMTTGLAAPVGFVSFDMDYYSSTIECLRIFDLPAASLLPVVVSYFDDVTGSPKRIGSAFRSSRAGQYLALSEFNEAHDRRVVDPFWILRQRRPFDREPWLDKMFVAHVLDHPIRSGQGERGAATMADHKASSIFDWPM